METSITISNSFFIIRVLEIPTKIYIKLEIMQERNGIIAKLCMESYNQIRCIDMNDISKC